MVDKETSKEERIFVPGIDRPADRPGHAWREVKGLDPTKNPNTTSGWVLEKISEDASDEPPFVWPPELRSDGASVTQINFMDKVDKANNTKKKP